MINALKKNGPLWELFTRREEYSASITDIHRRFPRYLSGYREIFEPAVSRSIVESGQKFEYPGSRSFAVCLTHDIDSLSPGRKDLVLQTYQSLKSGRLLDGFKTPFSTAVKKWNRLRNFPEIMALEEQYGAVSTFFFLTADADINRIDYKITDVRDDLRSILKNGWEVGLHTGYYSYDDPAKIAVEKLRLEKAISRRVKGCRNHFLRFKTPDSWKILSEAGFEYDTTFGYADCVGFRNGMCHPFRPYDLEADREINLIEIPLTIMDGTLFEYMRLDDMTALSLTKTLIDTVEKYRGVITILWHNTYMVGTKLKFYEQILKYCREKNAYMSSCEDIANICREQLPV